MDRWPQALHSMLLEATAKLLGDIFRPGNRAHPRPTAAVFCCHLLAFPQDLGQMYILSGSLSYRLKPSGPLRIGDDCSASMRSIAVGGMELRCLRGAIKPPKFRQKVGVGN